MDSYQHLPDAEIHPVGVVSTKFLELGITSFKQACYYVHNLEYGFNSDYADKMILFKEQKGTCTTKHAVIAGLAEELHIPVHKHVGIYKFTEDISIGATAILKKYGVPYVPMIHCFLVYHQYEFDLTEGNNNGKKKGINEFIHAEKVTPFINPKDEYLLFKRVLHEKVLPSPEMHGIEEKRLLQARTDCVALLKHNIESLPEINQ